MIRLFKQKPATKIAPTQHKIAFAGEQIEFTLKLAKRRTIAIHVSLAGEVVVKAPTRMPQAKIFAFVAEKAEWVLNKQQHFAAIAPQAPENTLKFLGKNYELQIELAIANRVLIVGDKLVVQTTQPSNKAKHKQMLDAWYAEQAAEIFAQRLPICAEIAKQIKVKFVGELQLRRMKSRWGSCSSTGEITLNIELVGASIECIDYVILHELCHLREHNHSAAFYALMSAVLPNWKAAKKELSKNAIIRKM